MFLVLNNAMRSYTGPLHIPGVLALERLDVLADHLLTVRVSDARVKVKESEHARNVDD